MRLRFVPELVPLAKPYFDQNEIEAVGRVIRSGWVTQGTEVEAFEREFAQSVGARHACAVSSGTAGLHLALLAAGVKSGDEVITVSHSYIATANSVRYCGAIPVFVDIESATFNIDPQLVEDSLSEKTRVILCVHQAGMPCNLKALKYIANRYSITLIEDAACAIGSEILSGGEWERVGKPHGKAACFSFHPRKVITMGEGGVVTTNDAEFDRRIRLGRQHGANLSARARHDSLEVISESYHSVGLNYRMTDIQAAIGREQLKRLSVIVKTRRDLAKRYTRLLRGIIGITPPKEPRWARSNWQSFIVQLTPGTKLLDLMQRMLDRRIATRRGIMCAHREPVYQNGEPWKCGRGGLRLSEDIQDSSILLPLFHEMTEDQQARVVDALRAALTGL